MTPKIIKIIIKFYWTKFACIGFSDKTIKWFHSYLTNRVIFVSLGTDFLEAGILNCRVPQGSILGPLMFLLYINDIPQTLSNIHTYLYADHTSIFCQHKDVTEIENVLNKSRYQFILVNIKQNAFFSVGIRICLKLT